MINVDLKSCEGFLKPSLIDTYTDKALEAFDVLESRKGAGSDFLGWMDLPSLTLESDIVEKCYEVVRRWSKGIDVVVVIGIGGSYLGAKSAIEALSHNFDDNMGKYTPQIVFAGQNLSEAYMADLMDYLKQRSVATVVISKSGTTTEPAVAFRLVKKHIESRYGKEEAKNRIVAITDEHKGALRQMADKEGYTTFVIPDNVGGRYSVLTPVGLLPIALSGHDIKDLLEGAAFMEKICKQKDAGNPAVRYAAARNAFYSLGKKIEVMVGYHPKFMYFNEWWKQLYGESEGKNGKGIFPASVINTTDLHSMGQYIQDGERHLFESILSLKESERTLHIERDEENLDGLNFLAGKTLGECNKMAEYATRMAHNDGGVPSIEINIEKLDEYHLGGLYYFFEYACALSGYVLGINPFDQPGVESYKKNMFALLGKPGYEQLGEELRKRL